MTTLEKHIIKTRAERLQDVAEMFHELMQEAGPLELLAVKDMLNTIKRNYRQFERDARGQE